MLNSCPFVFPNLKRCYLITKTSYICISKQFTVVHSRPLCGQNWVQSSDQTSDKRHRLEKILYGDERNSLFDDSKFNLRFARWGKTWPLLKVFVVVTVGSFHSILFAQLHSAIIYLFKVINWNTWDCEIYSTFPIKSPENHHWRSSGVPVYFAHISHLYLVFLLTLRTYLFAGKDLSLAKYSEQWI